MIALAILAYVMLVLVAQVWFARKLRQRQYQKGSK